MARLFAGLAPQANDGARLRLAVSVAAVAAVSIATPAEAATGRYQISHGVDCYEVNNNMLLYSPRIWAAYGRQRVAWRGHLYEWNGARFVWADSTDWRIAHATRTRAARFRPYPSSFQPPAGLYRVSVEVYWYRTAYVRAGRATAWWPNSLGGEYCRFDD